MVELDGGEVSPQMSVEELEREIEAEASKFPIGSPGFAAFSDTAEVEVARASAEEDLETLRILPTMDDIGRTRLEQKLRIGEGIIIQLEAAIALEVGRTPGYGDAIYNFSGLFEDLKAAYMQGMQYSSIEVAAHGADSFRAIRNGLLSPPVVHNSSAGDLS